MKFYWWLSLAMLTSACAVAPRPVVVPPPILLRAVAVIVVDAQGHAIPNAVCQLDGGSVTDQSANAGGYILFATVSTALRATQLTCTADGYRPFSEHRDLLTGENEDLLHVVLTSLRPVRVALPAIVTRGQFFALANGSYWTAVEISDFNLFSKYIAGEDIELILQQRQSIGFNLLRVWTNFNVAGIGRLVPSEHPDFYAKVVDFLNLAAAHNLYVEWTAYVQSELVDLSHWTQLIDASRLAGTQPLTELMNEQDQHPIDLAGFSRPSGLLVSHGSNGSEKWPVLSYWDYLDFHTNGADEEQRKVGHNAWEIWSGPTLTNETSRCCEIGMWTEDTARNEQIAFDSAAGAALLAAGSAYHCVVCKTSDLLTGLQLAAAKAWVAGVRSVPLVCQDGDYNHRIDLEGPDDLRVYQRGNDLACVVRIRR